MMEYEGSTFNPDDLRPDDRQRILWRLPRHILPWIRSPTISRRWVVSIRRWLPLVLRRTSLVASFADSSSVWLLNFLGLWSRSVEKAQIVGGGKVGFPPMGNQGRQAQRCRADGQDRHQGTLITSGGGTCRENAQSNSGKFGILHKDGDFQCSGR